MDLVALFRGSRRVVRRAIAPASSVAIAAHIARNGFTQASSHPLDVLLILCALAAMAVRLQVPRRPSAEAATAPLDAGVALTVIALGYVLVTFTGGTVEDLCPGCRCWSWPWPWRSRTRGLRGP